MVNLLYDCYQILSKVYKDGSYLKQALSQTAVEEKNRSLAVKTCYGVLDKNIELDYVIARLCDKKPKQSLTVILKISMYLVRYLNKKEYAVINGAVELTKKLGKKGSEGFVNAFLRKYVSATVPLPENECERLSVKYSYPAFALKKLIEEYGLYTAEKIASYQNERTTIVFFGTDGAEYLKNTNCDVAETPFYNVFSVKGFVRNNDYDGGIYTFQSIGSAAICEMIESGGSLLDVCAAPGGKSVNLSRKFAKVTSLELHSHRAELIKIYADRMKRDNVAVSCEDASVFNEKYSECFDAVLCDVPCSGFGVVCENPDIKLNRTEEGVSALFKTQLSILKNASRYVKKGGFLFYSTCSVFRQENSDVISAFMSDITDFEHVEAHCSLPYETKKYGIQFLPQISFGAGYYFCKLKRV